MGKNLKGLFIYIGIILLSVILTHKLPQDSYSIIQYIIKPIRFENSILYISGLVPLAMLFMGIRGLCRLEWFADKSKILITIIVFILVVPAMRGSLDTTKTTYLSNINEELKSIDLKDVDIKFSDITDSEATMNIKLGLNDYGKGMRDFKIRMYLPESLKACFNKDFIEFEESHKSSGHGNEITIDKQILIQLADGISKEDILNSQWDWETFEFELFNDIDSSKIIYHGV